MNLSLQFFALFLKISAVILLVCGTPLNLPALSRTVNHEKRDAMDIELVLTTSPTTSDDKEDFFKKLMHLMGKPREEEDQQDVIVFDHPNDVIHHDHGDYPNPTWRQCESCLEKDTTVASNLEPAYLCDGWDPNSKTCFLDRNVGDTVTFKLKIPFEKKGRVEWRLEFNSQNKGGMRGFLIPEDKPLWNIVIGNLGYEFRISPVTEIDVDSNAFSATLETPLGHNNDKIYFKIRPVPIDLGFVYPGESLVLNMASFIALPLDSVRYSWFLESGGESRRHLPSNMRESPSGGALAVDELRAEQGGVIVCTVHSNRGLQVAKKRFLVGNMKAIPSLALTYHDSFRHRSSDFHQPLQRYSRKIKVEEQLEKGLEDEENSTSDAEEEGFEYEMPYERKNVYDTLKEFPQSQLGDSSRQLPPPAFKNIENRKPGNTDSWSAQNPYLEEPSEKKEPSNKFSLSTQGPSSHFKQPFENKNPENKVFSSAQEPSPYYKHPFENKNPENKDSLSAQELSPDYKELFESKMPNNKYLSSSPSSSYSKEPSEMDHNKYSSSAQEPSSDYEEPPENKKPNGKYSSSAHKPSPDYKEPSEDKKPNNKYSSSAQEQSSDYKEPSENKSPNNKYSSSAQQPLSYYKKPWENKKPSNKYFPSAQEPSSDYEEPSENKNPNNKYSSSAQQPSSYNKEPWENKKPSNKYLSSAQEPSLDYEKQSESLKEPSILNKNYFLQVSPSRNGIFDTLGQFSSGQKGSNILSNTFSVGQESLSNMGKTIVLSTEDRLSKFIAECSTERQCAGQATCVRDEGSPGFCRCRSGYRGNGISCWESFNSRE